LLLLNVHLFTIPFHRIAVVDMMISLVPMCMLDSTNLISSSLSQRLQHESESGDGSEAEHDVDNLGRG
jgi:hypothetical protein